MSEHTEQAALFEWAAWNQSKEPALCLLFAIPNGGARDARTGARMKREGQKAGVPDIMLPVARMGYHGFWIELKHGKNKTSIEQDVWLTALKAEGYFVDVSYGWEEAAHKIVRYLGHEPAAFGLQDTVVHLGARLGAHDEYAAACGSAERELRER